MECTEGGSCRGSCDACGKRIVQGSRVAKPTNILRNRAVLLRGRYKRQKLLTYRAALPKPGRLCKETPILRGRRRRGENALEMEERGMTRRELLLALALGAGWIISAGPAEAQTRLRYAHVGSEGDIQYWFADEAARRSRR